MGLSNGIIKWDYQWNSMVNWYVHCRQLSFPLTNLKLCAFPLVHDLRYVNFHWFILCHKCAFPLFTEWIIANYHDNVLIIIIFCFIVIIIRVDDYHYCKNKWYYTKKHHPWLTTKTSLGVNNDKIRWLQLFQSNDITIRIIITIVITYINISPFIIMIRLDD